jgi:hypothetical protein
LLYAYRRAITAAGFLTRCAMPKHAMAANMAARWKTRPGIWETRVVPGVATATTMEMIQAIPAMPNSVPNTFNKADILQTS